MDNGKEYDLERRTFDFAKRVRDFIRIIPRTIANIEDSKQVVRSSGSVAANYREANESLSKKDFVMRVKISRKESKESELWLKLIDPGSAEEIRAEQGYLAAEAVELMKIFGSIIRKSE